MPLAQRTRKEMQRSREKGRRDKIEIGGAALTELAQSARQHTVHQHAITTITDEVFQYELQWGRQTPQGWVWADLKTPDLVPEWCTSFVTDAVESIAICGYFAYRCSPTGMWATVYPPETYTITSSKTDPVWKPMERGLTLCVVDPPRVSGVRSAVARAMLDTRRYDQLEHYMLERDRLNSKHTVFTMVSKDLKNQNGSTRQWFRSAVADESAGSRPHIDTDFNDLIKRRQDVKTQLQQNTVYQNTLLGGDANHMGALHGRAPPAPQAVHKEHAVSDGREYRAAPQLQSLTDGKAELDRVYTNIMLAFHVPPQIFGKNINTERHAASNRLTESAVTMFWERAKRIRGTIGGALKRVTMLVGAKSCVTFRRAPGKHVLLELGPALNAEYALELAEDVYEIPRGVLDPAKLLLLLASKQGTAVEEPQQDGGGEAAEVNGPKPKKAKPNPATDVA